MTLLLPRGRLGWRVEIWEKQNECERVSDCIWTKEEVGSGRLDSNLGRNAKLTGWVGIQGLNGDGSLEKLSLPTYAHPRNPCQFGWLMAPANLDQPTPGAPRLTMSSELAAEDPKTIIS
ncbi:hypothetical protein PpBr36_05409, partial [Pyricularia pennisetigena]|uniref:hypothetical protein n=1 Tax=Pyricularia pennisetigena TaxID=1578925 RepID=UPI0011518830